MLEGVTLLHYILGLLRGVLIWVKPGVLFRPEGQRIDPVGRYVLMSGRLEDRLSMYSRFTPPTQDKYLIYTPLINFYWNHWRSPFYWVETSIA